MKPNNETNFAILDTQSGRRRAVDVALSLTEDTPLAPKEYERGLLELFVQGNLSIDQVIDVLEEKEN